MVRIDREMMLGVTVGENLSRRAIMKEQGLRQRRQSPIKT